MKLSHYQAAGFYPISAVGPDAMFEMPVAAAITIEKGIISSQMVLVTSHRQLQTQARYS
jgi:hypothetical protein